MASFEDPSRKVARLQTMLQIAQQELQIDQRMQQIASQKQQISQQIQQIIEQKQQIDQEQQGVASAYAFLDEHFPNCMVKRESANSDEKLSHSPSLNRDLENLRQEALTSMKRRSPRDNSSNSFRENSRRRSRSRSPVKSRYQSRSRSRDRKVNVTVIPEIDDAKWLRHFYDHEKTLLDRFKYPREIIQFKFANGYFSELDETDVRNLSKMYESCHKLCESCYHGKRIGTGRFLVCAKCARCYPNALCIGKNNKCRRLASFNHITYSSRKLCKNCTEHSSR